MATNQQFFIVIVALLVAVVNGLIILDPPELAGQVSIIIMRLLVLNLLFDRFAFGCIFEHTFLLQMRNQATKDKLH